MTSHRGEIVGALPAEHSFDVVRSEVAFRSRVISVRSDEVRMPGGTTATRDVVQHPGAVGVVALDNHERVLLVTQYRHPVARRLAEIPAGLLDVAGEVPLTAARRELAEEAGVAATTWCVLVDALTSPGMTDEAIRIFLARDLTPVARAIQEHEELELTSQWVPLSVAVELVFSGELENAMACVGILAAALARQTSFSGLRAADAPWPAHAFDA
ncbi:MAG: NUDIX hydrolase [Actinomycetota bacterium]|nr:NUDIX hydrolase [Actinomycetota bacterium]